MDTDKCGQTPSKAVQIKDPTLREHLDDRIARARQELENLCIIKAKAETLQVLNYPMSFIYQLTAF